MKIVILDGFTSNPGDLSWDKITKLGDCAIYDRTSPSDIVERAKDAEIVLTCKAILDEEVILSLPKLKCIGVLATGYNVVDIECAKHQDIIVTNVPNYTGLSGAQMVFALLLELTNRVGDHSASVFKNKWSKASDFCFWDFPLIELNGLTLGIVGFGGIGKAVSRIAIAFGMKVIISTRTIPESYPEGIEFCDLDALFQNSDVITLHCPLTPGTKEMINAERINQMKTTSYLINISRGQLIHEKDLTEALNSDRIAGAALDVLAQEPPSSDCPLFKAKNCYITPHIAWATLASRERLISIAADNIEGFIEGKIVNAVNV
ncbi:D-2-hydroxyacid dehydrogenase [bacterium]|nr:D-2-hydroxyacid dehydrogenase [bacterium]